MPSFHQVKNLKDICIQNVVNHIDKFWVENTKIKSLIDINNKVLYMIGPFERLNDNLVDFVLKEIYKTSKLTKYHIYLLINTYLKKLDVSFLKKANIIDAKLCSFIGINVFVS